MKITYLGHSAFEIETSKGKILIDPFLAFARNYNPQNISDIFVTHAHADHLGNAIEISKKTGAKITAIFELANYCASKGANTEGISLGGWINYDWGKVIAVPAFHSSSTVEGIYGGAPCGFIFEIEGKYLYHAGDTSLNSEMKILGELYNIDLAMLPIGGHFTMDIEHALIASEWLKTESIIPMHYNSFNAIKVNIETFKSLAQEKNKKPIVLNIYDQIEF